VTVLGLGPMGQALATAFLDAGHPTTVWNRTPGRAAAPVARGATQAGTVADAVVTSPLVVVCVIDDAAARAIVEPVGAALRGRALVNLTSDTPQRAREMAGWAAAHGIDYLDGAIMSPAAVIGGPQALVLYSGPETIFRAQQAILSSLGGTAAYLGDDPGRAAAHDVALLDIFWTAMSGVVHGFALAGVEGTAPTDIAGYARGIAGLLPPIVDEIARDLSAGDHPGDDSTILSAAAGMAHIVSAADARGLDASVLRAATAIARQAIDAGHGTDGFSRLASLLASGAVSQVA
jgi:3-hydroxyisobutyrate dehydrogenase-like beta-hydroxyacid dehydrogenase